MSKKTTREQLRDQAMPLISMSRHIGLFINPFSPYQMRHVMIEDTTTLGTGSVIKWRYIPGSQAFKHDLTSLYYGIRGLLLGLVKTPFDVIVTAYREGVMAALKSLPYDLVRMISTVLASVLVIALSPIRLVLALTTRPLASLVYRLFEFRITKRRLDMAYRHPEQIDRTLVPRLIELSDTPERDQAMRETLRGFFTTIKERQIPGLYNSTLLELDDHGKIECALDLISTMGLDSSALRFFTSKKLDVLVREHNDSLTKMLDTSLISDLLISKSDASAWYDKSALIQRLMNRNLIPHYPDMPTWEYYNVTSQAVCAGDLFAARCLSGVDDRVLQDWTDVCKSPEVLVRLISRLSQTPGEPERNVIRLLLAKQSEEAREHLEANIDKVIKQLGSRELAFLILTGMATRETVLAHVHEEADVAKKLEESIAAVDKETISVLSVEGAWFNAKNAELRSSRETVETLAATRSSLNHRAPGDGKPSAQEEHTPDDTSHSPRK